MMLDSDRRYRVLLSFLGLGRAKKDPTTGQTDYVYDPAEYELGGYRHKSRYVQAALIALHRERDRAFDRIVLAMTRDSRQQHWERNGRLRDELDGTRVHEILIDDDLSAESQWNNFGKILEAIPADCELYVDLTHGFRAIPILFSVAIELLTQVKGVQLLGAYYGAFDKQKDGVTPVTEFSRFFAVNRWANAVRAVTEEANPSKLATLAANDPDLEVSGLGSQGLIDALEQLAAVIKNAQSEQVAKACHRVVQEIQRAREGASPISMALLDLLDKKFGGLAQAESDLRFSRPWYETQLALARVMVEHRLFMQGLTVLQELMISCCEELCSRVLADAEHPARKDYLKSHSWKDFRKMYKQHRREIGAALLAGIRLGESQWKPNTTFDLDGTLVGEVVKSVLKIHPRFGDGLQPFLTDLGKLRNAFNHAWVGHNALEHDTVRTRTEQCLSDGEAFVRRMLDEHAIGLGEPTLTSSLERVVGCASQSNTSPTDESRETRNSA
jgi:CRISPR-associated Csx2 family protein